MLTTVCPVLVAALAASHRRHSRTAAGRARSQRRAAWGSFSQRTIDRRYCGLPFIPGPVGVWYPRAVQLAGGVPSQLVWQPLRAAPVAQAPAICHFCAGPIDAASRCACFAHA